MVKTRKSYSLKVKISGGNGPFKGRRNCNRGSPGLGSPSYYHKKLAKGVHEQGPEIFSENGSTKEYEKKIA